MRLQLLEAEVECVLLLTVQKIFLKHVSPVPSQTRQDNSDTESHFDGQTGGNPHSECPFVPVCYPI